MDPRIRIRIHPKMAWIRNTGSGTLDQESEDGHEMTFAVNVLAHHLLTHRLKVLTHTISALRNSSVADPGSGAFLISGSGFSFFRVPGP
jgi:hypothetical protein